jgi:hypothetical protein
MKGYPANQKRKGGKEKRNLLLEIEKDWRKREKFVSRAVEEHMGARGRKRRGRPVGYIIQAMPNWLLNMCVSYWKRAELGPGGHGSQAISSLA